MRAGNTYYLPVGILRQILCVVLIAVVWALPAYAQECNYNAESIIRLRPPVFSNRRSWDMIHGEVGYGRFSDVAMVDDKTVVMVGDYTVGEEDDVYKPFILSMNERHDVLWETREETDKDYPLIRVVKTDDGFTALGQVVDAKRQRGMFIAHYTKDGKLKKRIPIHESGADIDPVSLIRTNDGKAFMIAAQYYNRKDEGDTYGLLYKVSSSGGIVWRRAYRPGIVTFFHDVRSVSKDSYMASGQIRMDDGRLGGWAVKLDENGAIQWQQSYPRGKQAALRASGVTRDGGFVFSGDVEPFGGGRKSGWVMVTGPVGSVNWQRYYTGDYNYVANDVIAYPDGRSDVLMAGSPLKGRDASRHAMLLTISPRGYLMDAKAFLDGQGAIARRIILGPKQNRIFVGTAQTIVPDDVPLEALPPYTFDAWLIGVEPLDPYNDPCEENPLDDIRPIIKSPF